MGDTILVGDIPIEVTRKRIKHVHLRVRPPNGDVTISAPMSARLPVVEAFAATRLEWIRRQQQRMRERATKATPRFEEGESHGLWGRRHELAVVERDSRPGVTCDDHRITLFVQPGSDVAMRAHVMVAWHASILRDALLPLIRKWEQLLNVHVMGFYMRRMKTRWGTCNYRTKHVRFNTELVTKPTHLLEYVVVHEMVHLIVPNHGARFVALMDEHYPAWREARAELNESGAGHKRRGAQTARGTNDVMALGRD